MKQAILILLLNLTIISGFSQEFSGGMLLGVCGSQIDGDDQFKYKKPGLIAGAFVSKPFTKNTALMIETYYIGKGAVLNNDQVDGSTIQVFNTTLHYVEMPFLFKLILHPRVDLAAGVAPSYLFAHKLTSYKVEVSKSSYSLNNFDFQATGRIGLYLTDNISSSIRFSYSIFDIRKEDMATWYNNNLSLVFTYKIK